MPSPAPLLVGISLGPSRAIWEGPLLREAAVHGKFDDAFYEGLARDLLERDGSEVVWRLRLEVIQTRREGHQRGAELLIRIADAADQLLRQKPGVEMTGIAVFRATLLTL